MSYKYEISKFSDQCLVIKGKKAKNIFDVQRNNTLPYILIDSFNGKYNKFSDDITCPKCEENDIIIVMDGASSGRVTTNLNGIIGSTLSAIKIKNPQKLNKDYLYYYVKLKYELLNKTAKGSAIPHTDRTVLMNLEIPIPSMHIQKQIVEILEMMSNLKKKREEVNQLANMMIHSTFLKMFGDLSKAKWRLAPLKEIVIGNPQNGLFKLNNLYGKGTKIAWVENISSDCILNTSNLKRVILSKEEVEKYQVQQYDVLVTRSSHLGKRGVGIMNVVNDLDEDITFESHIIKLKLDLKIINPFYLCAYFNTNYGRELIEKKATQATMSTINQSNLLEIPIHLPPIELQNHFASFITSLRLMRQKQARSEEEINILNNLLLQKSFLLTS